VDVDTAESAVGVTKVLLGGEGVLEWGDRAVGRGVVCIVRMDFRMLASLVVSVASVASLR
jgi:hypothetical protein